MLVTRPCSMIRPACVVTPGRRRALSAGGPDRREASVALYSAHLTADSKRLRLLRAAGQHRGRTFRLRLLARVPGLQAERGAPAQPDPARADRVADRGQRPARGPGRVSGRRHGWPRDDEIMWRTTASTSSACASLGRPTALVNPTLDFGLGIVQTTRSSRHARGERPGDGRLAGGSRAGDERPGGPRLQSGRRPAPRQPPTGLRLLHLQRLRGRDRLAADAGRSASSTPTPTPTTATASRRSSTRTPAS